MDDVEKYKSHKGPASELHIVDQYMMEVQFPRAQHAVARYDGAATRPDTPGAGPALVRQEDPEDLSLLGVFKQHCCENVIVLAVDL